MERQRKNFIIAQENYDIRLMCMFMYVLLAVHCMCHYSAASSRAASVYPSIPVPKPHPPLFPLSPFRLL